MSAGGQEASSLPDYVMERNRQAQAAGLTVERCIVNGTALSTWYRGTEAAWRRSPFCRRPADKPFPRNFGYCDFMCFSLGCETGHISILARNMPDGQIRGAINKEPLPEWEDSLPCGVQIYSMPTRHGGPVVYVGAGKVLVEQKLAPPEILTGSGWGRANGADCPAGGEMVWRVCSLGDGRDIYTDYVGTREAAARAAAERGKVDYQSPLDLLNAWRDGAALMLRVLNDQFRQVESKAGKIYTVEKTSIDEVSEAMDDLLDAISNASVRVRDSDPLGKETARRAMAARSDALFLGFLRSTGVDVQGQLGH
jgi:hypothetical protein